MVEIVQMKSAGGNGLRMTKYEDDVLLPYLENFDPAQALKMTRELPYRDGDILVCSYPKCGVNWFSSMLWKLRTFDFSQRVAGRLLELGSIADFDALQSPRFMYTHLQPRLLPIEHIRNGGKIILLLRNPKDVVVSYYYHYKNAKVLSNKQTFDEFFESYSSGEIPWGSFFDYLSEWESFLRNEMAGRIGEQIEVVFYESLKNDCVGNLETLNRFLKLGRDRDYLQRIVAETDIDSLREEMSRLSPHPAVLDENGRNVIFRKGVIGDWKNHFTVAQSERIDGLMMEKHPSGMFRFIYE